MTAHLSSERKAHMLEVGTEIYSAYLLLDMLSSNYYVSQSDKFNLNDQKTALNEYIVSLIKQGITNANFNLGGQACHILLTRNAGNPPAWKVQITGENEAQATELKPINEHSPQDLLNFFRKYSVTVNQDNTGVYKFSTGLTVNGKNITLGGANKLSLYQLHISNLYTILTRLTDKDANLNMLVAMATGSGKSFTQALWFLVQYLADNPCFFAAPSANLVIQLKRDFERLLPANVTQHIPVYTTNDPIATHESAKWGIMSHDKLLSAHWDFLQEEKTLESGMLLCIDEEHLATQEELFSKRIAILADHYPTMFLSATPSEESYQISGDQPVASLSRKEKEELGISKAAVSEQSSTQGIIKKSRKNNPLTVLESMIMKFVDSIEEERLSTAHEYVDVSETTVTYKPSTDPYYADQTGADIRRFLRWNIIAPIGEKALVLVDTHDPVVNMSLLRNGDSRNPYKNGNRVLRDNVYDFFQLGDNLDEVCYDNYIEAKESLRRKLFLAPLNKLFQAREQQELCNAVDEYVDFSDTEQYMEIRVLHGLIENTLIYLLGYDSNHLDYMRFHHLDKLIAEVTEKLTAVGSDGEVAICRSITEKLMQDGLPRTVSEEVAAAMFGVILKLYDNEAKRLIVDNWLLDKKLHKHFIYKNDVDIYNYFPSNRTRRTPHSIVIADFIAKYKTIFMVNGLEKTATPIESNRPFFSLTQSLHAMDDEHVKNNDALKHQLSPLEALDDTTKQAEYTPNYCPPDYTPAVVDTLFRKGLVGAYITSERITGFNDPHLHHVSMIVDSETDPINTPDQIIQGSGRNRGLNPAHQPHFILTTENGSTPSFSPDNLEKKNYYPDFFKAKKRYQETVTKRLGKKIALAMKDYIEANIFPDGTIDTHALSEKLRHIVITEFEQVYKNNEFDFKKTKKIFKRVLADTYNALYVQIKALNRPYHLPRVAKVLANLLNFITKIYYKLATVRSYFSFVRAARRLKADVTNNKASSNEETYAHIVRNFNYKTHIAKGIPGKRFKDIFKEDAKKILEFALQNNIVRFLNPEIRKQLLDIFKNELSNYFLCFVGSAEEQLELLHLIQAKSDWLEKAIPHVDTLMLLDDDAVHQYFEIIKTDPDIAEYFSSHNLQIELNRENLMREALDTTYNAFKDALDNSPGDVDPESPEFLQLLSKILSDNIDNFKFLFVPKDAAFLAKHKNKLSIDVTLLEPLIAIANNPDKGAEINCAIVALLRSSLPADILNEADANNCLALDQYNPDKVFQNVKKMQQLFTDPSTPPNMLLDMNALHDLLAKNLDLKNPILKDMINHLLGSFSAAHLETILNALYPLANAEQHDLSNKDKVKLLLEFKQDIKKLILLYINIPNMCCNIFSSGLVIGSFKYLLIQVINTGTFRIYGRFTRARKLTGKTILTLCRRRSNRFFIAAMLRLAGALAGR